MKKDRSGYTHEVRLLTFGHGTLTQEDIARLVAGAGLERVVDVRTTPKSRRHPWVWREEMERWLQPESGAAYEWAPQLGGRRKTSPQSHNIALRHPAFRGYADYMETPPFREALHSLVESLAEKRTAIMCSETLWWRCHRRLISDACVLLYSVDVQHLDARGQLKAHVLTEGVRRAGDVLRYDAGVAA